MPRQFKFLLFFFLAPIALFSEPLDYSLDRGEEIADLSDIKNQLASRLPNASKNEKYKSFILDNKSKRVFDFQTSIGVGFLRFSGLKGNVSPYPRFTTGVVLSNDAPLRGPLGYNRTPLYEFSAMRSIGGYVKLGLSYQYQGDIFIQSALQDAGGVNAISYAMFESKLSLNGFYLKSFFESPKAFNVGIAAIAPYLGVGLGAAWQSWTQVSVDYETLRINNFLNFAADFIYNFRQKNCANFAYMIDTGLSLRSRQPHPAFNLRLGCKYNQWGQARNLGKLSQQGRRKLALFKPVGIKVLYQFAPYASLQWNFALTDIKLVRKDSPSFFSVKSSRCLNDPTKIWTQINGGIGFLYFDGVQGNLAFEPLGRLTNHQDIPIQGHLVYNRTPLLEYQVGYQFNRFVRASLSYQRQSGISLQTQQLKPRLLDPTISTTSPESDQLMSDMELNSIAAKGYFDIPLVFYLRQTALQPYLGFAFGPAWISSTQNYLISQVFAPYLLPLKQKISPNAFFMIDVGFALKQITPSDSFNLNFGCKYNEWGQILNVGKVSQQGNQNRGLFKPFRVRTVYQFAPYLGMEWNFPNPDLMKKMCKGSCQTMDKSFCSSWWAQFNIGCGFLYFDQIKGSLMNEPAQHFFSFLTDAPFKGPLNYNRTPIYEFLFGYQIKRWLKVGLSYQNQNGIEVASNMIPVATTGSAVSGISFSQFHANLSLNGLMLKGYLSLPGTKISFYRLKPYLGAGVGASWQTWNNIEVNYILPRTPPNTFSFGADYRQKVSANCMWGLDAGLSLETCTPQKGSFALLLGCRYNQWGQARSMGKITQQNYVKIGLRDPLRVKVVYQFAPYGGFQWNF